MSFAAVSAAWGEGFLAVAGESLLAAVFVLGEPVVFPAEAVEEFLEEAAGVDVFGGAHAGDETVDVAFAAGGEGVGGFVGLATGAAAGDDEPRIDNGADEGDAFVDGLAVLLLRVEGESELAFEELLDGVDVAQELLALVGGNDDEEVVDIATVVFIAEVKHDEAVELVEEDVAEELAGEVADDDAATFGLVEEAFADGEVAPV